MSASNRKWAVLLTLFAISACSGMSMAVTTDFQAITSNNPGDVAIGEAQLSMDVTPLPNNQVAFTFYNTGPDSCVITQIYFEQGSLADIVSIDQSPGVSFHEGGTPRSLPAGNSLSPRFSTAFMVSADKPSPHNGVANSQPPEQSWVSVVFTLAPGKTFDEVKTELSIGSLRVGLHIQCFDSGGSESFINNLLGYTPPYME